MRKGKIRPLLMVALALLSTTAPLAMDLYLPSFPEMRSDLNTSAVNIQLTMTAYLFGLATGQLLFGWLSDRFGRRGPLLFGTTFCVMVSALAALAPSVDSLIALRSVQAFTGAAGIVIARAIITDVTRGDTTARTLSLVQSLAGVVAVAAPVAGGVVVSFIHWRGVMWVLTGVFAVMLVLSVFIVPETSPRHIGKHTLPVSRGELAALLKPKFVLYLSTFVFTSAVLMAYIAASPFVYETTIGWNELEFGIAFAVNAVFNILGSLSSARLVRRFGAHWVLGLGLCLLMVLSAAILALGLLDAQELLFIPLPLLNFAIGMCFGNATALALGEVRRIAGSGSAALGSSQYVVGGIATGLVGLAGSATVLGLGLTATGAALIAVITYLAASAIHRRDVPVEPNDTHSHADSHADCEDPADASAGASNLED